ncbi:MAG: M28 family peptidase [Candidatus Xenobiia bacterium LiM19]
MKKNTALIVQYLLFTLLFPVAVYLGYCTFFRSPALSLPEDRSRAFNSRNAAAHLKAMRSIGEEAPPVRSSIYKYIRNDLLSRGLKVTEFFTTLRGSGKEMKSLVGIVPGEKQDILIVSTHHNPVRKDSSGLSEGAALALALELSRVFSMKKHQMTIWFLFLDGNGAEKQVHSAAAEQITAELIKSGELAKVKAFISLELPTCTVVDPACQKRSSDVLLQAFKDAVAKTKKDYLYRGRTVDSPGDLTVFQKKGVPSIQVIDDAVEKTPGSSTRVPARDDPYRNLWALGTVMERFIVELDSKLAK